MTPPDFARELGARLGQRVRGRADAAPVGLLPPAQPRPPARRALPRRRRDAPGRRHPRRAARRRGDRRARRRRPPGRAARAGGERAHERHREPAARGRGARHDRAASRARSRSPAGCCRATCATTSTSSTSSSARSTTSSTSGDPDAADARRRRGGLGDGRPGPAPRARSTCSRTSPPATRCPAARCATSARACGGDLDGPPVRTEAELDRYCYRVAGTVGIVMAAMLGTRDARAPSRPPPRSGWPCSARTSCATSTRTARRAASTSRARPSTRFGGRRCPGAREALLRDQIARPTRSTSEGVAGIALLRRGRCAVARGGRMYREILRQIEREGYGARPGRAVGAAAPQALGRGHPRVRDLTVTGSVCPGARVLGASSGAGD